MLKPTRVWFKNSKGQKLAGDLWTPKGYKHTVIFVNGVSNTRAEWVGEGSWPDALAKLGYRVLTFDCRGRGESEGKFSETTLATNIDDLESAINFLDSDVVLAGGSFGGTTSICVAKKDSRVKSLVTMAAAHNLDYWDGGKRFAMAKEKGYYNAGAGKIFTLELFQDIKNHKVLDLAAKVKMPWLIIHGDKDTAVPVQQAKDLYMTAKCEKKLVIIKGAGHGFEKDKEDAEVLSLIKGWLRKWLK